MKRILILIISVNLIYSLSGGTPCTPQWDQYLGNPGRTAYIDYDGPDSPEILWEVQFPSFPGYPYISEDTIVIECGGRVVLIDLLTGTILDEAVADVKYLSAAYPLGDRILGTTAGNWLYRINPATGEASFDVRISYDSYCWARCHPIILSDKIFFSSTPVVCLSVDDYSTLWDLQSTLGSLYPEDAEIYMIAASSERLHIALLRGEEEYIWTVDINTGEFLWKQNGPMGLMIAADEAFVVAAGENLNALDARTGEHLWTFEFESGDLRSNIILGPRAVFATDRDYLYSIDKTTGVLNWKVDWKENPFTMIYIVGTRNAVICNDVRNLSCFSAEDGTEIWNVHFSDFIDHNPIKLCPAVGEGILIAIGEENSNRLLALASDPELFERQGDVFFSEGLAEKAINSYEKAVQLYEKEGNLNKSQEMEKRIHELENLPETSPPKTPELTPPESPPEFPLIPISALIVTVMIGISIAYYFFRLRKS